MIPTGLENIFIPSVSQAIQDTVDWLYSTSRKLSIQARNTLIKMRYEAGEALSDIARSFKLSPQRIHQIVNDIS